MVAGRCMGRKKGGQGKGRLGTYGLESGRA